ncbi:MULTISPECIES: outer membrane protein [unclassified Bartonella]|uniref:outer membrane protein n=1 Tax=unclassified Bartonella TaxID=2645622 RepID=UPI00235EAFA8|nr:MULTISPECIES: outer membrane protein [unclassified Bartonella]
MNIKSLITTSVVALISASAVQAADVVIPHESTPVITAPTFSWTGFYIGGQVGNFSSTTKITVPGTDTRIFTKDETPKPSGFMGGIYAGSNIDLGSGLILGVETDAVWAGREETKKAAGVDISSARATELNTALKLDPNADKTGEDHKGEKPFKEGATAGAFRGNDNVVESYAYKEKWSGATRVRIGFAAADRVMPYVAGGIAYAQVQGVQSVSGTGQRAKDKGDGTIEAGKHVSVALPTGTLFDETKTMVGFTIGGGIDFAMTDNVLLRAEYRYSDFGKKKFANNTQEFSYKTNDFRVGVAYKF